MLKYVVVDSDGYAYLPREHQGELHRLGYSVGRSNDEWLLFRLEANGAQFSVSALIYETADHVLFDNYLKLILED